MADINNKAPRSQEGILDDIDDALADSFPASDPPSQSSPTKPSSPPRQSDRRPASGSHNDK